MMRITLNSRHHSSAAIEARLAGGASDPVSGPQMMVDTVAGYRRSSRARGRRARGPGSPARPFVFSWAMRCRPGSGHADRRRRVVLASGGRYVETEDPYVQGDVLDMSTDVSGLVDRFCA